MTYIWEVPNDCPNNYIGEYDVTASPDRFLFRKAEPFPAFDHMPTVIFPVGVEKLRGLDILPNNAMIPLVSGKVLAELDRICGADIEAVPAIVQAKGGDLHGFSFLNILTKMEAIDLGASECLMIPGTKQVMKFRRLRLMAGGIGLHHFARDPRYASYAFISKDIVKFFSASSWRYFAFKSTEDVRA